MKSNRLIITLITLMTITYLDSEAWQIDNGLIEMYARALSRYINEDCTNQYSLSATPPIYIIRNGIVNEPNVCYNGKCPKSILQYMNASDLDNISGLYWMNIENPIKQIAISPPNSILLNIYYYLDGKTLTITVIENTASFTKTDENIIPLREIKYVYILDCDTKEWIYSYKREVKLTDTIVQTSKNVEHATTDAPLHL